MKIACSTASFERVLGEGSLTQLEWLDLCANELELEGVVFDARHFPRTDDQYLAQLKKSCIDLGLTVAGLAADDVLRGQAAERVAQALALGAPLVAARAPAASEDPAAWGAFVDGAREAASEGKRQNVTLALRNAPGTLCGDVSDLKRLAKDVDSAWLRFAPEVAAFGSLDPTLGIVAKAVLTVHTLDSVDGFATGDDPAAPALIRDLRRFRGFVLLERAGDGGARDAYHRALERFRALRAAALDAGASAPAH
ncbi:MAG: sugar phosphate isomerase/epimerase family protein [Vulcanimicrobiaceae bacterium]